MTEKHDAGRKPQRPVQRGLGGDFGPDEVVAPDESTQADRMMRTVPLSEVAVPLAVLDLQELDDRLRSGQVDGSASGPVGHLCSPF